MRTPQVLHSHQLWLVAHLLIATEASISEVHAREADVALHRHSLDIEPGGGNSKPTAAHSLGLGSNLKLLRRESPLLMNMKTNEEESRDNNDNDDDDDDKDTGEEDATSKDDNDDKDASKDDNTNNDGNSNEEDSGDPKGAYGFMQAASAGDVSAFCIDNDVIYAVAADTQYRSLLRGNIYKQDFMEMTPSTNWTLIGYGSMISIAVRNGVMYGVGSATRQLWQQQISEMHFENVWRLQSRMKLSAISILDKTIYAVFDEDGKLYKQDFPWEDDPDRVWELMSEGPGKIASFSIVPGKLLKPEVYAQFDNNKIYHKVINQDQPQLEWGLKGEASFWDISVEGDSMYAVGEDNKIYRQPLRINFRWATAFSGSWQSITIRRNKIYGLDLTGRIWSQILREDNKAITWKSVTGSGTPAVHPVKQILIQGDCFYAVSQNLVYKQMLHTLSNATPSNWVQTSKCCAKSIAAADGLIYAVGPEHKLYVQVDTLMTIHSEWTLVADGPVKSITFRGDTIYGVQVSGHVYEQRMSTLTPTSSWMEGEMLEDPTPGPSGKYLQILAHGDTMYAVGEDKAIYSKLLQSKINWPVGVHELKHDTRFEALTYNLTDLTSTTPIDVSTTEAWQESSTALTNTTTVSLLLAQTTAGVWVTTSSSHEVGLQAHYIDHFNSPTGVKQEVETGQVLPPPYRPPDSEFPDIEARGTSCSPGKISWMVPLLVVLCVAFREPRRGEGFKGRLRRRPVDMEQSAVKGQQ